MIRIRYIRTQEPGCFHTFILNEEKTLCGQDVPYGLKAFATAPYGFSGRCPDCQENEHALRALSLLTGEEEPLDPFERLSKGRVFRKTLNHIQIGQRCYDLKHKIEIQVTREEKDFICQDEQFGLYGIGSTFPEAYQEYCEAFDALYKDYVETDDPLSESGLELADRLRALVNR